jgi:hypothetical protein
MKRFTPRAIAGICALVGGWWVLSPSGRGDWCGSKVGAHHGTRGSGQLQVLAAQGARKGLPHSSKQCNRC